MNVVFVYLGYLWICLIHSIFSGVTLYAFLGEKLIGNNRIYSILILTGFLLFLETYWIPVIGRMDVIVNVRDPEILQHFGINEHTNIAAVLRPTIISVCFSFLQGIFSNYIGRKAYFRILNSSKYN